jgi:hypothetical protein
VSFVTVTVSAAGTAISTAEVVIPRLPKGILMLGHEFMEATDFLTRKTAALLQPDRVKPKLRNLVLSFDVRMGRFLSIAGVKEEPVGTDPQNCRHEQALVTRRILACRLSQAEVFYRFTPDGQVDFRLCQDCPA